MDKFITIVTVGHVDHGKSTVLGRLLADTDSLPQGKLDTVKTYCRKNAKPFEYAFLLDALKEEQAQGITIDTARCFFHWDDRRFLFYDAPGHIEFIKNMVTGASQADAALLIVDAKRGIEDNTKRHCAFLSLLGIHQIAVLINKMDLVEYQESQYKKICEELSSYLHKFSVNPVVYLPISALEGDNITSLSKNMPWYQGLTVLEQLMAFTPSKPLKTLPFRMPIQCVYKFTEYADDRRIIAGTILSGSLSVGDSISFLPSGKKSKVKSFETFPPQKRQYAHAGQAVGFTVTDELYIPRGEIVCKTNEIFPYIGVRLLANVFWLGSDSFSPSKTYTFKVGTSSVTGHIEEVVRVFQVSNMETFYQDYLLQNEVGEVILKLDYPIAFDSIKQNTETSRFVIIDQYRIAGGGSIIKRLNSEDYDLRNIKWSRTLSISSHTGMVIWMTGLSGAGKTTIAESVKNELHQHGHTAMILDGDMLRAGLNKDLGFSAEDRIENIRRTAHIAKLFQENGQITFVTLISPFESARAMARDIIGDSFVEVYVQASLDECEKRDPKQLYKKAHLALIPEFTGISSPYEVPKTPDLILNTETHSEAENTNELMHFILKHINKL